MTQRNCHRISSQLMSCLQYRIIPMKYFILENGKTLKTVALRPSFIYGEEDPRFMTSIINVAQKMGGRVPKLAGAGGKQQVVYAGLYYIY